MDKRMDQNNVVFLAAYLQHIRAAQALNLDKYQRFFMNINLFKIQNDENSVDSLDTLDTLDSVDSVKTKNYRNIKFV